MWPEMVLPFMYCGAWGEEKFFYASRGLCWVSHQIFFFQFLYISQTTGCKGGPRSTYTFHLRTEMSVLVPECAFNFEGFIFKSWPGYRCTKFFHGFSESLLGSDGQVLRYLFFFLRDF
jgi:hypothetical protein